MQMKFMIIKLLKLILVFIWFLSLNSCMRVINPKERNTLTFENNIEEVYDSILVMNKIVSEFYFNDFAFAVSDNNELYFINYQLHKGSSRIGVLSDSLLYKNDALNFLKKNDIKRFLKLCDYQNRNYLSRCDVRNNHIVYTYRANIYMADWQTDLNRIVVTADSIVDIDLTTYKILDKYKNLYLLANKDAKIYEGENKR